MDYPDNYFDIVHFHGIGPSAFIPISRLGGQTVVSTLHALDWRQAKWGALAKRALKGGEKMGARQSHGVIAVSRLLVDYIRENYGVEARYIPNGATVKAPKAPRLIAQYGLEGNDYILTVGRIIRDRALHQLIEAFKALPRPLKLVIVGSELVRTAYSGELEAMADDRVIFTGDLFGEALDELYSNCRLYVLPSLVEGLPITACEAMAFGRGVLLSDIPENLEVGGDVALYFNAGNVNSLRDALEGALEDGAGVEARGARGRRRIETDYSWDAIAEATAAFYAEVLEKRGARRRG